MGNSILKDGTVEEKLARADKALMQLERRIAARSIVAPLTPIVIMGHCAQSENGVIFRGVFPMAGFITKVSFFVDEIEDKELLKKEGLKFIITARQITGDYQVKELFSKRLSAALQGNFKVSADSLLTIAVNANVFGVSYGFVMEPEFPVRKKIEVADIEQKLIEE